MSSAQEQTLITLPRDLLFSILNELDDDAFADLCATSRFFRDICQDQQYWKLRYIQRFGVSKRNYIDEYRLKTKRTSALDEFPVDNIDEDVANETFLREYVWGDSAKGRKYFRKYRHIIDVDYDDGYFFVRAAEQNDEKMLRMLLAKNPKSDLSQAVAVARRDGYDSFVKTLLQYIYSHP